MHFSFYNLPTWHTLLPLCFLFLYLSVDLSRSYLKEIFSLLCYRLQIDYEFLINWVCFLLGTKVITTLEPQYIRIIMVLVSY